jgi:hypothetical protein
MSLPINWYEVSLMLSFVQAGLEAAFYGAVALVLVAAISSTVAWCLYVSIEAAVTYARRGLQVVKEVVWMQLS